MKAIILAAGRGSRLGNYTKELPKALVDINGKSLIERQIHLFQKNNITQIFIVRGYMKEKFNLDNIQFIDDDDYTNHDQLGSLMAAQEKISGEVLISFADLVFDENILQQILDVNEDISLALDLDWQKKYDGQENNQFPALAEIENNRIIRLSEKEDLVRNNFCAEFFGILKLSSRGSEILNEIINKNKNYKNQFHDSVSFNVAKLPDIIQEIIESDIIVTPIFIRGKWIEVDTPKDLEKAKTLF